MPARLSAPEIAVPSKSAKEARHPSVRDGSAHFIVEPLSITPQVLPAAMIGTAGRRPDAMCARVLRQRPGCTGNVGYPDPAARPE